MEFTLTKKFPISPDQLFEDFKNTGKMRSWLVDGENVNTETQSDFSPGGKYHMEMRSPIGNISHYYGEYTSIMENQHIDMVWHDESVQNSLVTFDFIPNGKRGTTLVITHANLPDKHCCQQHKRFWKSCMSHLDSYVKKSA